MDENQLLTEQITGITASDLQSQLQMAGLGVLPSNALKKVAAKINNKFVNAAKTITPTKASFINSAKDLPVETKAAIQNGNAKFRDFSFFHRKVSGVNSIVSLLLETDAKAAGVKNFDKKKLPVNLTVDYIAFQYVHAASTKAVYEVQYAPITASSDAALYCGEFRLRVGGKVVVDIPISSFQQGRKGLSDSPKIGFNLPNPIFIRNDESIEIEVEFAGTVVPGSSTSCFTETQLCGTGLAEN